MNVTVLKQLTDNPNTTSMTSAFQNGEPTESVDVNNSLSNYHSGLVALAVLVFVSNLFAISFYLRHRTIRGNPSNVLLFSLAISDLIVALALLPLMIGCERTELPTDSALQRMCRCSYPIGNLCGFSTIFHIIALTLDEYQAVLHPFKRMNLASRGYYRKILILIWLMALFFALIPVFWIFKDQQSKSWRKKFHNYGILQIVIFFGVSVIILTYSYCRMFVRIRRQLAEVTLTGRVQLRVRNDRKTILVFLLFFTVFAIGWFPWFFFTLDHSELEIPSEIQDFLVALRFAGSFLNPLIYAFLKNDYKEAIKLDLALICSRCPKQFQCFNLTPLLKRSRSNIDKQDV